MRCLACRPRALFDAAFATWSPRHDGAPRASVTATRRVLRRQAVSVRAEGRSGTAGRLSYRATRARRWPKERNPTHLVRCRTACRPTHRDGAMAQRSGQAHHARREIPPCEPCRVSSASTRARELTTPTDTTHPAHGAVDTRDAPAERYAGTAIPPAEPARAASPALRPARLESWRETRRQRRSARRKRGRRAVAWTAATAAEAPRRRCTRRQAATRVRLTVHARRSPEAAAGVAASRSSKVAGPRLAVRARVCGAKVSGGHHGHRRAAANVPTCASPRRPRSKAARGHTPGEPGADTVRRGHESAMALLEIWVSAPLVARGGEERTRVCSTAGRGRLARGRRRRA